MIVHVKCYRCGKHFTVDYPLWFSDIEIVSCPHCDEDCRVYPPYNHN